MGLQEERGEEQHSVRSKKKEKERKERKELEKKEKKETKEKKEMKGKSGRVNAMKIWILFLGRIINKNVWPKRIIKKNLFFVEPSLRFSWGLSVLGFVERGDRENLSMQECFFFPEKK